MVLVTFVATYLLLQSVLMPATFGDYGHYRASALDDEVARRPAFQGRDMCYECHDDIVDLVLKDTHHSVNCEDCHGPADLHVRYQMGEDDEGITEEMAVLPKIKDRELCLLCHRKLRARPSTFPQIVAEEHVAFLRKDGVDVDCVECHSPHEPIFLLTEVDAARAHPVIQNCSACHESVPERALADAEGHTPVFQCQDCHGDVVADTLERSHADLTCGVCHQYTRVSDTAGRIFKNGNPRFCLLCHEDRPFKDADAIPVVRWPDHLDEEQIPEEERESTCIECHWDKIHAMSWAPERAGDEPGSDR
jgi:hypothetical protein